MKKQELKDVDQFALPGELVSDKTETWTQLCQVWVHGWFEFNGIALQTSN